MRAKHARKPPTKRSSARHALAEGRRTAGAVPMSRRGGPRPVAATVLSAVALLGAWQLRVVADEQALAPDAASQSASGETSRDDAQQPGHQRRLREGTQLVNCLGHFRQSGDVVSFIDESGREIGGLPNLNLERITRMLKTVDEPESVWWSVSGTITEFAGRNYVLIHRAVYKASTPPPTPETIDAQPQT